MILIERERKKGGGKGSNWERMGWWETKRRYVLKWTALPKPPLSPLSLPPPPKKKKKKNGPGKTA